MTLFVEEVELRRLVAADMTCQQISDAMGERYGKVRRSIEWFGLQAKREMKPEERQRARFAREPKYATKDRDAAVVEMFLAGSSQAQIAREFGMSRERARQIIAKKGLTAKDGPHRRFMLSAKQKAASDAIEAKNARSMARYGIGTEEMDAYRAKGLTEAYRQQKNQAKARGIEWLLSFLQWIAIWQESGKLSMRGRGSGRYVMSRKGDCGPYAVGNVFIQTANANSREALVGKRPRIDGAQGVWCLYPGNAKPWVAKFSNKSIGSFSSQEEALQARKAYLQENLKTHRHRGYAYISGRKNPYQVMVGKKYVGCYASADAAIEARREYLQQQPRAESS